MTKRTLLLLFTAIVMSILSCLSIIISKKNKQQERQNAATAYLYSIKNINKLIEIAPKIPSIFIAFSPDCEHCQYEAKSINERQKDLENVQIVMFTIEKDSLTKAFVHVYGLDTLKNIKVISDSTYEMHNAFGIKTIPSIFIYSAEGKLLKHYKGETKIEAILKAIQ
jgi:thioredoxin-related protein